jgi:hypothetical protein
MIVRNRIRDLAHRSNTISRTTRRFVATSICVSALVTAVGGPLSNGGQAHADTLTATCGVIDAYTASTTTTQGLLTMTANGSSTSTTTAIAAASTWTGLPPVVGDSVCVSPTLDATGAISSATVTGAIMTPTTGLFTVGPFVMAHAQLFDASGNLAGIAVLAQDTGSGLVYTSVTLFDPAATAGPHAVQIGSVASCAGSTFASSDSIVASLPDMMVNNNGYGDLEAVSNLFSLSATTPTLLDSDGSSILISSAPSSGTTTTAGSSILCGVITAG